MVDIVGMVQTPPKGLIEYSEFNLSAIRAVPKSS